MSFFTNFDFITVIIIGLFIIPIIIGIISPFSSYRMQRSLASLLSSVVFLVSVILSFNLTSKLLSDTGSPILTTLHTLIPSLYNLVTRKDIWVYIIIAVLMTCVISGILYLVTLPLYRYVIVPVTNKISTSVGKMNGAVKRILGGLWELPKSMILVIVISLLLNFFASYNSNTIIEKAISRSTAYQIVDKNILKPILNSDFAKKIPVLLSDSFNKAAASLEERNIHLIRYFNGMTLDDAVKSNDDIDTAAEEIIGKETNEKEKAKLLYVWISQNITYDHEKAAAVAAASASVSSGAIDAYSTKTGICFDYACLYIAMCRAVDVKVRFITGAGYSGTEWGDHAWNQIHSTAENRWINVDTTFGNSGTNYFDRPGFSEDHQYAVVQQEW